MSRIWFGTMVAVGVLLVAPGVAHAQNTVVIAGSGSGVFETPAIAGGGVWTATCTLDGGTAEIACSASVYNIGNLTAGHMHVGGPGVSGPVVLGIAGLPTNSSGDFTHSWTWTADDVSTRPAQGVTTMTDVFQACASGNCYLNFHTTANRSGEIRINMCPQGERPRTRDDVNELGRFANQFYGINVCEPGR